MFFKASPDEVYNLLMDSKKHSAFTGTDTEISKASKGKFTVYDGYCHGYNIELIPKKRLFKHGTLQKTAGLMTIFQFVHLSLSQVLRGQSFHFPTQEFPNINIKHLKMARKNTIGMP